MRYTVIVLLLICGFSHAQESIIMDDDEPPFVHELNVLNNNFLNQQRNRADKVCRQAFGRKLQSLSLGEDTWQNIVLLQRIIDKKEVSQNDKLTLQSLGVVLGDIYVDQVRELNWKVYEDELGKTHAVCIDNTKHCIFPVTMLSRRIEGGLTPDVEIVYNKGLNFIKDYLPKKPFN